MDFKLRSWTTADAADIARAVNNPDIHKNLRDGLPYPYTERDGLDFIESTLAAPPDSAYAWAIEVEGTAAGSLGMFRQGNIHRQTAELGYWLAEPYWGKGITSRAVREACERLFETTDILRIYAEPFSTNAASRRVLEKAGFQLEGILRKNAVKAGQVMDMCMYSRLRE